MCFIMSSEIALNQDCKNTQIMYGAHEQNISHSFINIKEKHCKTHNNIYYTLLNKASCTVLSTLRKITHKNQ